MNKNATLSADDTHLFIVADNIEKILSGGQASSESDENSCTAFSLHASPSK